MRARIDRSRCTGCGACMQACPVEATEVQDGFAHVLSERCTGCGICAEVCPQGAVLLLAEPAAAAGSRGLVISRPDGQPVDRSGEIVTVQVPLPAQAPPRPAPARQLGLALGAALSCLSWEVAPRLVRMAADWVQGQIHAPQQSSSRGTWRQGGRGAGGQRRRRQRRGRR